MTDAKHRAQEAAPASERDAIVAWLQAKALEALSLRTKSGTEIAEVIVAFADALARGDHLKGDVA